MYDQSNNVEAWINGLYVYKQKKVPHALASLYSLSSISWCTIWLDSI
jgi:hypothetical protein